MYQRHHMDNLRVEAGQLPGKKGVGGEEVRWSWAQGPKGIGRGSINWRALAKMPGVVLRSPGERQVSMSGKYAGIGGGHRTKEANQVTIMGSPEVGSGQLSRKKTPSPGYTFIWSEWIEERGDNREPGEGGADSTSWRGEPSGRKAKEVRKVASSNIMVCISWRVAVVGRAIKGKMLISGDGTGIKKLGSPCVTCLLMLGTGSPKSINDLIRGSDAKRRKRFVRMSGRGSVGQIEKNIPSSDKVGGGEVDTRATRRGWEWSKEGVESRRRSKGA